MLTLGLISVSHGSSWDSDVDMDTMCLPKLDGCGSSSCGAVSLLVLSNRMMIVYACGVFSEFTEN